MKRVKKLSDRKRTLVGSQQRHSVAIERRMNNMLGGLLKSMERDIVERIRKYMDRDDVRIYLNHEDSI